MADLEGPYTAYLPVPPKAAREAILNIAEYPRWSLLGKVIDSSDSSRERLAAMLAG